MKRGFGRAVSSRALLAVLCFSLFAGALSAQPATSTVALPFYNGDGYSTVRVIVNPTDREITLPFVNMGCGSNCVIPTLGAHQFERAAVNAEGLGVFTLELNEGLQAYSEITTPIGVPVRIDPLTPRETSYVYDLERPGQYNGGLFIAAESDSAVQVIGGEGFRLSAGSARIVTAPGAIAIVENRWNAGSVGQERGRLYVFGFINHWITGGVENVPAR